MTSLRLQSTSGRTGALRVATAERGRIIDLALGLVLVTVNGLLALGVLGSQLSRFPWTSEASAQTYYYYGTAAPVPAMSLYGIAVLALFIAAVGFTTLARPRSRA